MIDSAINLLIALAFAALFGSAALMKLRTPAIFIGTLADYRLIPRPLLSAAGALVIVLEAALTVGLLWPATREICSVIGAAVLLVYGAAIAINLLRGRHNIDCGCSLKRRPIGRWMVVRNVLFAAALLTLTLPIALRPLGFGDVATVSAGLFVLALLHSSLDMLEFS